MILYNTIVGLAAGVALILVAGIFKQLANGAKVQPEGYALSFGITGFILTVLDYDLRHVALHQGVARQHYDGRAGAGLRSIARRSFILSMAQERDLQRSGRR